jgi:uncharacterized surface protein with fasciclin (FAS1) repeats
LGFLKPLIAAARRLSQLTSRRSKTPVGALVLAVSWYQQNKAHRSRRSHTSSNMEVIPMKTLMHSSKAIVKSTLILLLVVATAAFSFSRADIDREPANDDIVDVAVKAGSFNTLVAAVKAAGLVETLKGDGPFTVFAPTDEAFAKLPAGTVEDLLKPENKDQLVAILTYHVVPGEIMSSDLLSTTSATTVNGQKAPIGLRVGNANVIKADVDASNGVIHVIDTVLLPE